MMALMFLFRKRYRNLVAVIYEGPGRLRLNANRKAGRDLERAKKGAMVHEATVCWFVMDDSGQVLESGQGPAAARFPSTEVAKMLRSLPTHSAVGAVIREMLQYEQDRASKVLSWSNEPKV